MKKIWSDHLGNTYDSLEELCVKYKITVSAYYQRQSKGWSLEQTLTAPLKQIKIDHRGEKHTNNDGLEFEIIDSPDAHHITIRFTNSGNVKTNVYYADILHGMVKDRVDPELHVGETNQMKCGKMATIVEFLGNSKYKVLVDGVGEKICEYYRFERGELGGVTTKQILKGTIRTASNGEQYTVLSEEFGAKGKCVVQFENGIQKTYTRNTILNNNVRSLKATKQTPKYCGKYAIGNVIKSKGGYHYKILAEYNRGTIIDVVCKETQCQINGVRSSSIRNRLERNNSTKLRQTKAKTRSKEMESFIGTVVKDRLGRDCKVIGGKDFSHLDIERSDGIIIHNVKRHKFLMGLIPIANSISETQRLLRKQKYEKMTFMQRGGYIATCVLYQDSQHITIQYQNGKTQNTDIRHFTHGLCIAPMLQHTHQSSINEFTILYCLKQAGFIHTTAGMLKELKHFKNKTIDIYHPIYKIGIEYDGPWHKRNHQNDILKDKLCKNNGIYLYRVRESSVPLLNDGIAHEYQLNDNHYFSPSLCNTIEKIVKDICKRLNIVIDIPDLSSTTIRDDIIQQFSNNYALRAYINKQKRNKAGRLMTITAYRNSHDIDVIFDNGYQSFHRNMSEFNSGKIACKERHYGEVSINRLGMAMEIVSTGFGSKVDVRFEDGTLVPNQQYAAFLKGQIKYPNHKQYISRQDNLHLGEVIQTNIGQLAEIIEVFRDNSNRLMCISRFEDGYISKPTAYQHAKCGNIKHPDSYRKGIDASLEARHLKHQKYVSSLLDTNYISPDGFTYQIIRYADSKHVRCRFTDGFELNTDAYSAKRGIWRYIPGNKNRLRNTGDFDVWCNQSKVS